MARVREELEKYNDFDIHLMALELAEECPRRRPHLDRYILTEADLFQSAKCVRLAELVPALVKNNHRILIFSVWTSCLDLLGCLMERLGLAHMRMQGSTPVDERQSLIDMFNRDASIPVFLLSTTACGLGINLTAADTCIMHDMDFNPFNDLQAEDRCHRIGQKVSTNAPDHKFAHFSTSRFSVFSLASTMHVLEASNCYQGKYIFAFSACRVKFVVSLTFHRICLH